MLTVRLGGHHTSISCRVIGRMSRLPRACLTWGRPSASVLCRYLVSGKVLASYVRREQVRAGNEHEIWTGQEE